MRLGRDRLSGRLYAVKMFSKQRLLGTGSTGRNAMRVLERERDLLRLMASTERAMLVGRPPSVTEARTTTV